MVISVHFCFALVTVWRGARAFHFPWTRASNRTGISRDSSWLTLRIYLITSGGITPLLAFQKCALDLAAEFFVLAFP
jgi:hypothetical protein